MAIDRGKPEMLEILTLLVNLTPLFAVIVALMAVIVSLMALALSVYTLRRSERRRRSKLVNAVYHHADMAVTNFEEQQGRNDAIRQKIEDNDSYTPYVAYSSADDLTYDQVIELMECLKAKEEKDVLFYFYCQMDYHALGQSFNSEYVRGWPRDRKLQLWVHWERKCQDALDYAKKTRDILKQHRDRQISS